MSQDTEDAARSRLLASLNARVRRFADSGDPSGVLDDAALGEVREVLRKLPQDPGDPQPATWVEVLQVLAFLYWSRYQSQPAATDKDDLRAALEYFRLLGSRAPERVPGPGRPRRRPTPARRSMTWFPGCWSPGGRGRNYAAWPPGAASPDQFRLRGGGRRAEQPGEGARALSAVQPRLQTGEVAADHRGDELPVSLAGLAVEPGQERPVPGAHRVAETAERPRVGMPRRQRRLDAVGSQRAGGVGEGQAGHSQL
jgi:hypothetical protein